MALQLQYYICSKCGRPFVKWSGGFVLTEQEKRFKQFPVCDICRKQKKKSLNKREEF